MSRRICLLGFAAILFALPATAAPTFYKDVLPILQQNCQSCHRPGQIGPFSMLTYKEMRPWAKAIKAAVAERKMPPWFADPKYGHFNNDRSLKQSEIDTITAWVDSGAAEGNAKDAPAPIPWPAAGWQVQPDVVVELPPFQVSARGVFDWMTLVIPAPFQEDTWITSMEILPSEPSAVHHACWDFYEHKPEYLYNTYEWSEIPRDDEGIAKRTPRPAGAAAAVKKVVDLSTNTYTQLPMLKNAGHAASIFAKEPDLEADIVIWFRKTGQPERRYFLLPSRSDIGRLPPDECGLLSPGRVRYRHQFPLHNQRFGGNRQN